MIVKNKTIDQLAQEFRTNFTNAPPNEFELEAKLIRQNKVIFGENPGWKTEIMFSLCSHSQCAEDAYGLNFITIANKKVYFFEFEEKPLKVPESLPIVNKMLDSFRTISIESNFKQPNIQTNMSLQESNTRPKTNDTDTLPNDHTLGYSTLYERTTNAKNFYGRRTSSNRRKVYEGHRYVYIIVTGRKKLVPAKSLNELELINYYLTETDILNYY